MPDLKEDIQGLLQTYKANRALTLDLIHQISDRDLYAEWNRPGLKTFGAHFAEMAAVGRAFANALESGTMDFSTVPATFRVESKEHLLAELRSSDESLVACATKADPKRLVDWGDGVRLSPASHLVNVIAHETFHQGMMTMAMYALGIRLPDSWVRDWALPPTEGTK